MRLSCVLVALASLGAVLSSTSANADLTNELSHYIGYTIIADKTVKGWVSKDGTEAEENFKGCKYGTKIVFTDNTYLTCATYSYHYAYRPEAIILYNGSSYIMIVDSEAFDMRQ